MFHAKYIVHIFCTLSMFYFAIIFFLYDFYSIKIQPRVFSLAVSWTEIVHHTQSCWARMTGHGGLLRVFSFTRPIRGSEHV